MTGRTLFFHISPLQQGLFYLLAAVTVMSWWRAIAKRRCLWKVGRPSEPASLPHRFESLYRLAFKSKTQPALDGEPRRVPLPVTAMHFALIAGLCILTVGTTVAALEHLGSPLFGHRWFYAGYFYLLMKSLLDLGGLALLLGVSLACLLSLLKSTASTDARRKDQAFLVLTMAAAFTGFLLEGAGIAADPLRSKAALFSPVGSLFAVAAAGNAYTFIWWLHIALVLLFLALLPYSRWRHLFLIPFTAWLQPERPMTALAPSNIEELETRGTVGLQKLSDFTQWQLLSLDACMDCGRCTSVCPATQAGSPLDPHAVILNLRTELTQNGGEGSTAVVGDESLWACTNCHACVQVCPARIRHVDIINGIRRYRTAEGTLPPAAATVLKNIAARGNPWGAAASSAAVPENNTSGGQPEYLFWIGCSGAFDPEGQRTVKATAEILTRAGITFKIAGPKAPCSGEPARRLGEEFLFQETAGSAIEAMQAAGTAKIVTQCPHCLNTIKHEYPALGGTFEAVHHTQLLAELVATQRIEPMRSPGQNITFHDPCFLARGARETSAPRALISAVSASPHKEPAAHGAGTRCCGAGGGQLWMENGAGMAEHRIQELIDTGATTIVTGCPFCRIMLSDAARKRTAAEAEVPEVVDAAELLLLGLQASHEEGSEQ
jgi:Fe-S oxidoreductase/nitrate reductase gamma subunit